VQSKGFYAGEGYRLNKLDITICDYKEKTIINQVNPRLFLLSIKIYMSF